MAETLISWADYTFNPWIGCTKVSPGCDHCYAERDNSRRKWVSGWGAGVPRKLTSTDNWRKVEIWNERAPAFFEQHGHWPRVFCASLADVFDNEAEQVWRRDLFTLIQNTQNLRWLLLTKRIGNVEEMIGDVIGLARARIFGKCGFAHVGIMATVVNQNEADRDIPKLLRLKADLGVTWVGVSIEPMLGPIDLAAAAALGWCVPDRSKAVDGWAPPKIVRGIDWVIAGGESGPGARPSHPDWFRTLRDQCASAGVPFHFKQWGEWAPCPEDDWHGCGPVGKPKQLAMSPTGETCGGFIGESFASKRESEGWKPIANIGKKRAGRLLDGRTHDEFPNMERAA